jgi:aspartyl-tRNA(Asn)/glutamyl-tRNA(Gln) amidotransferase subunit A
MDGMAVEMKSSLERLTLAAARAAVVEGRVSAAALAEEHYERIALVDPEIHSYLALTRERAMAQAERVDAAVKAGGPLGPLAGVPVGIKDVLTVKGVATTAGSKIL